MRNYVLKLKRQRHRNTYKRNVHIYIYIYIYICMYSYKNYMYLYIYIYKSTDKCIYKNILNKQLLLIRCISDVSSLFWIMTLRVICFAMKSCDASCCVSSCHVMSRCVSVFCSDLRRCDLQRPGRAGTYWLRAALASHGNQIDTACCDLRCSSVPAQAKK